MSIIKSINTPNGVPCEYHKAVGGEFSYRDGVVVVRVGSWYNQAACDAGQGVLWSWPVSLPVNQAGDAENVMVADPASPFYQGLVEIDTTITLASLVARRWNEIKQEKVKRETGLMTVDGRVYQCNMIAMSGATLGAFMALSANDTEYRQLWVLYDNTDVLLTAAEMVAVGIAAKDYITGLSGITQALRAQLDAALTAEDVATVIWPTDPVIPG